MMENYEHSLKQNIIIRSFFQRTDDAIILLIIKKHLSLRPLLWAVEDWEYMLRGVVANLVEAGFGSAKSRKKRNDSWQAYQYDDSTDTSSTSTGGSQKSFESTQKHNNTRLEQQWKSIRQDTKQESSRSAPLTGKRLMPKAAINVASMKKEEKWNEIIPPALALMIVCFLMVVGIRRFVAVYYISVMTCYLRTTTMRYRKKSN